MGCTKIDKYGFDLIGSNYVNLDYLSDINGNRYITLRALVKPSTGNVLRMFCNNDFLVPSSGGIAATTSGGKVFGRMQWNGCYIGWESTVFVPQDDSNYVYVVLDAEDKDMYVYLSKLFYR